MFPALIEIGGFSIAAYGPLVAAAWALSIFWLIKNAPAMGLSEERFWSLIYWIFFGAIIGGKLLYIAVEHRSFASGELSLWRDFRYGFIFFGGLLGSTAASVLVWRRLRFDYWRAADYFSAALALGHSVGRLGCLASGCCYGKPTSLPWGLSLGGHPQSVTPRFLWGVPLHPVQIYESLFNLALFIFLSRRVIPAVESGRLRRGGAFVGYLLFYSGARFALEFLRGDERGLWGGLATSQWAAIAVALGGAALWGRLKS